MFLSTDTAIPCSRLFSPLCVCLAVCDLDILVLGSWVWHIAFIPAEAEARGSLSSRPDRVPWRGPCLAVLGWIFSTSNKIQIHTFIYVIICFQFPKPTLSSWMPRFSIAYILSKFGVLGMVGFCCIYTPGLLSISFQPWTFSSGFGQVFTCV